MNRQDRHNFTALMLAVNNEHLELVDILIEAGADVNTVDHNRRTALMECCVKKSSTMCE